EASVRSYTSLAVLNAGQAVIFTFGLAAVMVMCAIEIRSGTKTVGDFVLINAMMIQLYQPLNFMGMVYREIKQAITDIEIMCTILARDPEIKDVAHAPQLKVTKGTIRFENVSFANDPVRPILKGISFEVPAGRTVAVVGRSGARGRQTGGRGGPFRRGEVDDFAPAIPLLRSIRRPHFDRWSGYCEGRSKI